MTVRLWLCLVLLAGGIAIGDAFLRPSPHGSVVLSVLPGPAQPARPPDYAGQVPGPSAEETSRSVSRTAIEPQTTPKRQTPSKVDGAGLTMGAWTTETTFVAPVENPPSSSVADLDTGGRMTLGGPIMRPAGVIEEDGGRSPSPVPAITPTDVSQKPETTPTSLRATPRSESSRARESSNLFVHPLGF
jgi:hypothetical protein